MVFGAVVSGQALVRQVEMLPVDRNARPLQDAVVTNCGQLVKLTKGNKHQNKTPTTRLADHHWDSNVFLHPKMEAEA